LAGDGTRIESIVGLGTPPYGEKPEAAARNFLRENAQLFGLQSDLADLRLLVQSSRGSSGHVEFQQTINQLPIENARVQINLSKDGRILHVVSTYTPSKAVREATLTKEQAIEA